MVAKVTKLHALRSGAQPTADQGGDGASKPSLRQEAYGLLKEAILNLDLPPGRVTTDSELSRLLNMSRTPVREALTLLERDHLVLRIPNQGVLIRELSMDDVVHILQMREAMDGLAARLAVDKIDPAVLDALEAEFLAMNDAATEEASALHMDLSRRLHSAILDAAGNPFLSATSRELNGAFERMRSYNWKIWNASAKADRIGKRRYGEHLEIIAALKARDPRRAEKAARQHIVSALDDMLKTMIGAR